MKRPVGTWIVIAATAVVLCGCGASGDPLRQARVAVGKTLAVTWARYEVALERQHLFDASLTLEGGRAAYDFGTGLGYEFLQLRSRGGFERSKRADERCCFCLHQCFGGCAHAAEASWRSE